MGTGTRVYAHRVGIYEVRLVREGALSTSAPSVVSGSNAAAKIAADFLMGADRERMIVLLLNTRHGVIGINTVSVGGLSSSQVHPREVFKPAILAGAAAVILAHNHPSGEVIPSRDDIMLTEQLRSAGRLLGIEVLDHLIIGDDGRYTSLREQRQGGFENGR